MNAVGIFGREPIMEVFQKKRELFHLTKLAIVKDINFSTFDCQMRKITLFISIFFVGALSSIASTPADRCDSCKRVSISIFPIEMIGGFETIYLDYKFSKHFSLGIGAGHVFPFLHLLIHADEPIWNAYNGTIFRANFKYSFHKGLYIGLLATYKSLYYSWQDFASACRGAGSDAGLYYFTRSENTTIHGFGFMVGYEKQVSKYFGFNFFLGIGENTVNRSYTIHTVSDQCHHGSIDPLPIPGHYTKQEKVDSFPMGIKLVYTIHEKN